MILTVILVEGRKECQEGLTIFYDSPYGDQRKKAISLFEIAAEKGYPPSYMEFFDVYNDPESAIKDEAKAEFWKKKAAIHFQWFKEQAEMGDPEGEYYYALVLWN